MSSALDSAVEAEVKTEAGEDERKVAVEDLKFFEVKPVEAREVPRVEVKRRTGTELLPFLSGVNKQWEATAASRQLLREGAMLVECADATKPRWCFLFNDCLVISKPDCDFTADFALKNDSYEKSQMSKSSSLPTAESSTVSTNPFDDVSAPTAVVPTATASAAVSGSAKKPKKKQGKVKSMMSTFRRKKKDDGTATTSPRRTGVSGDEIVPVKFRVKQVFGLSTVILDESPKSLKEHSSFEAPAFVSDGFVLYGQCHAFNPMTKKVGSDLKSVHLAMYGLSAAQRELWLGAIHASACACIDEISPEIGVEYAWESSRRLGTLHSAVMRKDKAQVSELLATGRAQVDDTKDVGGHSVLHIACAYDFEWFIDIYGAKLDANIRDPSGNTPLALVCEREYAQSLRALVTKCREINFEERVNSFWNVFSARKRQSDSEDADYGTRVGSLLTPKRLESDSLPHERNYLHVFAQVDTAENVEMLEILLSTRMNMEAFDGSGQTPLHVACANDNESAVIAFLHAGVPVNVRDYEMNTPLHLCFSLRCGRWLAAYGARLTALNKGGVEASAKFSDELNACAKIWNSLMAKDAKEGGPLVSKDLWMEDELSTSCFLCGDSFSFVSRKHHCRFCGLLVCGNCSKHKLRCTKDASGMKGKKSSERACDKCFAMGVSKMTERVAYVLGGRKWEVLPKTYVRMAVLEETSDTTAAGSGGKLRRGGHKTSFTVADSHLSAAATGTASAAPSLGHARGGGSAMTAEVSKAHTQASRNLDKTKVLAERSERMADSSAAFADMAKQLADKYK